MDIVFLTSAKRNRKKVVTFMSLLFCWLSIYNTIIAFEKRLKNILKEVVLMTTQIINNFNSLNSEDLSTVKGGACSFWGATAAVGVGAVGGAIKGGIQTGTWQGAALKGIGYGIKDGITYGLICRY